MARVGGWWGKVLVVKGTKFQLYKMRTFWRPVQHTEYCIVYLTCARRVDLCSMCLHNMRATTTAIIYYNNVGERKLCEAMVMSVAFIIRIIALIPKLIKVYILNMYRFLHANHISIKWLKNNKGSINFKNPEA